MGLLQQPVRLKEFFIIPLVKKLKLPADIVLQIRIKPEANCMGSRTESVTLYTRDNRTTNQLILGDKISVIVSEDIDI